MRVVIEGRVAGCRDACPPVPATAAHEAGELRVGGTRDDPTTGTRVRINNPVVGDIGIGRNSKGLSPARPPPGTQ
jgi:hypothetical protein